MKIIVFTITYNNADVLPFFLRHYSSFVDEISAFDDQSTDSTRDMLRQCPKVILREWPYPGSGIDEELFLKFAYEWHPKARPAFDWVIWADPDEFIHAPDIREVLIRCKNFDVIRTRGYNMMCEGMPLDDGKSQIYELCKNGIYAPVYSKPVVFKPGIPIKWNRGKHDMENVAGQLVVTREPMFKLLHYRYLGYNYTKAKNARNYERCGLKTGDKGPAWSCAPGYRGEHSADWARKAMGRAINVVDAPV